MSDTLKIRVRKTKRERRALTREEAYARVASHTNHRFSKDAWEFLKCSGIDYSTYLSEDKSKQWGTYGSAEFCTETVLDATPDEIDAWHVVQRNRALLPSACYICRLCQGQYINAKKVLEDKEIILEVIYDN
jgi:hypothetical protein